MLRKRSIPGSPRGSVKSNNLSTAATIHTSPLTVNASTSATVTGVTTTNNLNNSANQTASATSWDAGHHHYHSSTGGTSSNSKASASRSGNYFSALDSALTMTTNQSNQQQSQPSTSQTAAVSVSLSNNDGASKLSKSILTSSTLAAATAAAFSGETDSVNLNGKSFVSKHHEKQFKLFFEKSKFSAPQALLEDAEDPDVGRLQALLEARGIPPHVFGSLGKLLQKITNFLHFSVD